MKDQYIDKIRRMQALCKNIEGAQNRIEDGKQAEIDLRRYEEELSELSEDFINGNF